MMTPGLLYTITIGLSAFLLFQVQPLLSRVILPLLGGGVSVWLTCLVFFQAALLFGYWSSHWLAARLGLRRFCLFQACIVAVSLLWLPLSLHGSFIIGRGVHPSQQIFVLLFLSVGIPYIVLSMTSPTLQYWIACDSRMKGRNPYVLYAVSNAGSLLGLLTYPFVFELLFGTRMQGIIWSGAYLMFAALVIATSLSLRKVTEDETEAAAAAGGRETSSVMADDQPSRLDRTVWMLRAMVPSAALLAITHYLTIDIVNAPFLWIIPLVLYLLTFVLCFSCPALSRPGTLRTMLVFFPLALLFVLRRLGSEFIPFDVQIVTACGALFAVCMFFHGDLERSKPEPRQLTMFYLYLSLGGVLGSIFVGIASPLLFSSAWEFNLIVIASFGAMAWPHFRQRGVVLKGILSAVLVSLVAITWVTEESTWLPFIVHKERSFYGNYEVQEFAEIPGQRCAVRLLVMGTTIHGGQARDADGSLMPITYFHEKSGIGRAFEKLPALRDIGVVGLGTGLVALYGTDRHRFDFYEIDAAVDTIARGWFKNLSESASPTRTVIGDARLSLKSCPNDRYDMLILDAFTSGAIPTHLLTLEAMEEFLRVLRPDGVILYHISNRHVDLWPVLQGIARQLGLFIKFHEADAIPQDYKTAASWVILTKNSHRFIQLTADDPRWVIRDNRAVLWTDDYFTVWPVMTIR